jgi:hypothetical protein
MVWKETQRKLTMFTCYHLDAGKNRNIKIDNRSFENVAKFKYMRMTVPNQNCIHREFD